MRPVIRFHFHKAVICMWIFSFDKAACCRSYWSWWSHSFWWIALWNPVMNNLTTIRTNFFIKAIYFIGSMTVSCGLRPLDSLWQCSFTRNFTGTTRPCLFVLKQIKNENDIVNSNVIDALQTPSPAVGLSCIKPGQCIEYYQKLRCTVADATYDKFSAFLPLNSVLYFISR